MKSKLNFWIRKIVGTIVFVIFLAVFINAYLLPMLASHFGVASEARITQKYISSGKGTLYVINVDCDEGAQWVRTSIDISSTAYGEVNENQMVAIHYLPGFPSEPALDISPPSLFQFFLLLFVILIISFGFWLSLKQALFRPAKDGEPPAPKRGSGVVDS